MGDDWLPDVISFSETPGSESGSAKKRRKSSANGRYFPSPASKTTPKTKKEKKAYEKLNGSFPKKEDYAAPSTPAAAKKKSSATSSEKKRKRVRKLSGTAKPSGETTDDAEVTASPSAAKSATAQSAKKKKKKRISAAKSDADKPTSSNALDSSDSPPADSEIGSEKSQSRKRKRNKDKAKPPVDDEATLAAKAAKKAAKLELKKKASVYLHDIDLMKMRTIEEVDELLNGKLRLGMKPPVAKMLKIKWEKREERRQERIKERAENLECYQCRGRGHLLSQCPFIKNKGGNICFKCGTTEHISRDCSSKVQGYPYASCFICGEQGHLVRDCPKNDKGIYPQGGQCKECGSKNHIVQDCPKNQAKENRREVYVGRLDNSSTSNGRMKSADEDMENFVLEGGADGQSSTTPKKKKKPSVVTF